MTLLNKLIGIITDLDVVATFKCLDGSTAHEHCIYHNMTRHEASMKMKRYVISSYYNSINLECPIIVKITRLDKSRNII